MGASPRCNQGIRVLPLVSLTQMAWLISTMPAVGNSMPLNSGRSLPRRTVSPLPPLHQARQCRRSQVWTHLGRYRLKHRSEKGRVSAPGQAQPRPCFSTRLQRCTFCSASPRSSQIPHCTVARACCSDASQISTLMLLRGPIRQWAVTRAQPPQRRTRIELRVCLHPQAQSKDGEDAPAASTLIRARL